MRVPQGKQRALVNLGNDILHLEEIFVREKFGRHNGRSSVQEVPVPVAGGMFGRPVLREKSHGSLGVQLVKVTRAK